MLRVHSEADAKGGTVLRLEGSLIGPWIEELLRAAEAAPAGQLAIDLAALGYADKDGERVLRDLAARAELRGCSPFLAEVLRGG
jgi:anti-anti-sigma regulatory factor